MKKEHLLIKIDKAFSNVPYPNQGDFFKAIADRDYEEYEPPERNKVWSDITKDEIIEYYDFIFFLSLDGVIYYLPSYMSLILKYDQVANHHSPQCLFMTITDMRVNILNEDQRDAVLSFLYYCRDVIHPAIELDDVLLNNAINHLQRTND